MVKQVKCQSGGRFVLEADHDLCQRTTRSRGGSSNGMWKFHESSYCDSLDRSL